MHTFVAKAFNSKDFFRDNLIRNNYVSYNHLSNISSKIYYDYFLKTAWNMKKKKDFILRKKKSLNSINNAPIAKLTSAQNEAQL